MKQSALMLFIPLLLISSCSQDDSEEQKQEIDKNIELYVYYQSKDYINETFMPDFEATVYVYFDIILNEPFTLEENGVIKITKTKQLINPMQAGKVNENGYLSINPLHRDKAVLIIVESNYYSGTFAKTSFYNCNEKNIATFKFTNHIYFTR